MTADRRRPSPKRGTRSLARELSGSGIRVTENVAELYDELRRAK